MPLVVPNRGRGAWVVGPGSQKRKVFVRFFFWVVHVFFSNIESKFKMTVRFFFPQKDKDKASFVGIRRANLCSRTKKQKRQADTRTISAFQLLSVIYVLMPLPNFCMTTFLVMKEQQNSPCCCGELGLAPYRNATIFVL